MVVLAVLIPVALLGVIAWVIVGLRQRTGEAGTLAGAGSLYAHVMSIVGTTMALLGGGILVKALIGFIDLRYSYQETLSSAIFGQSIGSSLPQGTPNLDQIGSFYAPLHTRDIILALTLIAVGLGVVSLHQAIARRLALSSGGDPVWVRHGSVIAYPVLYGFAAILALAAGASGLFAYFVIAHGTGLENGVFSSGYGVPATGAAPFGEALGAAALFAPAWVISTRALLRSVGGGGPSGQFSGYVETPVA